MSDPSRLEGLRILRRLEVPDHCDCPPEGRKPIPCGCREPCDCPVLLPPPCPHVLARDHGLTLPEWAELQAALLDDYTEPPPPHSPALALTREARVAVYSRRRREERRGLYHDDDLWRRQPKDDGVRCGVAAKRVANGYLDPDQSLAIAGRVGPEEGQPGVVAELLDGMGPVQAGLYALARHLLESQRYAERRAA